MHDEQPAIAALHSVYCQYTKLDVSLSMSRVFTWRVWQSHGWTEKDLSLVISHLKSRIKQNRKWPECLSFSRLIADTESFEEHLSVAKAESRTPKVAPGLATVLKVTGRPVGKAKEVPVRSAADVLAAVKAREDFVKLGKSL